ncbi:MAG TPA: FAD-dependent oxidoreductase, partial [Planctomycetota bacterium]|nr:FAD-dependent oxidoreductase [Planctomycetota bacterium]
VETQEGQTRRLHGDVVLIATGSSPRRPAGFLFDDPRIHDSDEILRLDEIPRELVVIGAGVIGCEYACTFAALGTKVFLVDKRAVPLGFLDLELSQALLRGMRQLGIELCLPDEMVSCEARPDAVVTKLQSGRELKSDGVLVAAGRSSNTANLGLEAAGITPGKHGLLEVNSRFQTSVPHIYAAGDVIGFPALASTSMEQARMAMVSAFDLKYKTSVAEVLPYGIYTIPEISMAGATEEELQQKGVDYICGRARYPDNARGTIIGDESGFLKLIFARDDLRLLGVHVIGEIATELLHIGLMALMTRSGAPLFIETCFNYPTLGELYKYATYDALGRRSAASRTLASHA